MKGKWAGPRRGSGRENATHLSMAGHTCERRAGRTISTRCVRSLNYFTLTALFTARACFSHATAGSRHSVESLHRHDVGEDAATSRRAGALCSRPEQSHCAPAQPRERTSPCLSRSGSSVASWAALPQVSGVGIRCTLCCQSWSQAAHPKSLSPRANLLSNCPSPSGLS